MEKIKEYVRKEIIFQNLQHNKARAEVALEILRTTGLVELPTIIYIKDKILQRAKEIEDKENLFNKEELQIIVTEY